MCFLTIVIDRNNQRSSTQEKAKHSDQGVAKDILSRETGFCGGIVPIRCGVIPRVRRVGTDAAGCRGYEVVNSSIAMEWNVNRDGLEQIILQI